jgi:hypothetical protein
VRRGLSLGLAIAILTVAAVAVLVLRHAPQQDGSGAVLSGREPASAAVPTTTSPTIPEPVPEPPPSTILMEGSSEVVATDAGGVTIVNSGSASASTGGNTAVGPDAGTVVTGPVSVVGNSSEVRISRP